MRLIDADALIEHMEELITYASFDMYHEEPLINVSFEEMENFISEQPTIETPEAVLEELKTGIPMLRPCIIHGNKGKTTRAFFHKWSDYKNVILPSALIGGHEGGKIEYPVAIIELEDGHVTQVSPTTIQFTDINMQEGK